MVFVRVSMEGRAIQMENVFVNLDLVVQCVNHVYLVSLYKYKLSLIVLI
jgi:hypothetical protein